MVSIIISYHIRTTDNIRMIEPVTCSQLAFSNILNNALWHGMEICCIWAHKGNHAHRLLGCKLYCLFINSSHTGNLCSSFLYKSCLGIYAFKHSINQSCIGYQRACQTKEGIGHIIRGDRRTVWPYSIFIDMNNEIFVILCGNGICQQILKSQILCKVN